MDTAQTQARLGLFHRREAGKREAGMREGANSISFGVTGDESQGLSPQRRSHCKPVQQRRPTRHKCQAHHGACAMVGIVERQPLVVCPAKSATSAEADPPPASNT
jgi:hypothetical protein